jgi:Glycosyltransferases involved in cell wall biogenesis
VINIKMLTIIIPTRNRSKRVSDLIESFSNLSQDKFEWEVLVIDNASNDDTKIIVNKLKNKCKFKN